MKIVLAEKAGFCMGVRRAVDTCLALVEEGGYIATFGPLIHNPQVLEHLKKKGVHILEEMPESIQGKVVVRAHGIPPQQKKQLRLAGADVRDATCPRVQKVQAIIKKYSGQGYDTVIIGDKNHAEVLGLMGFAQGSVYVVSNIGDLEQLNMTDPFIVVSQTTQDKETFLKLSSLIRDCYPACLIFNTICDSTHRRQYEVLKLGGKVDAIVVVGGRGSANTRRLRERAEGMGKSVFLVESEDEIDPVSLAGFTSIGVTAGASTPSWVIDRVVKVLEGI
ncbi:MAG: 4-hydroxy-3-methylbut-2-enyl diphosphate reductase [Thermodesulfobacteriota bacterium]